MAVTEGGTPQQRLGVTCKKKLEGGGEARANTDVESCGLAYLAACFLFFFHSVDRRRKIVRFGNCWTPVFLSHAHA